MRPDKLSRNVYRKRFTHPFASLAWELGEEPFFPDNVLLSSLRLRAAYGESSDSRPLFDPAATFVRFGIPSSVPTGYLPRAERSDELEWGAEAGMFKGRATLDATFFRKTVRDGFTVSSSPPSTGRPPFAGPIDSRTTGVEVSLRATLGAPGARGGDVGMSYTRTRNEVITFRGFPIASSYGGGARRFVVGVGYPLDGIWMRAMTFVDANGDGVIVPGEVTFADDVSYAGSSTPTRELGAWGTIRPTARLSLHALVDYRGGFKQVNATAWAHCAAENCEALYDPRTSLKDQASAVSASQVGLALGDWVEDGDFVRLREVSISWRLSARASRLVGTRSATLTLAGRNLATWTGYTGLDPEASVLGQSRIGQVDYFSVPIPRTFSLRVDAGW